MGSSGSQSGLGASSAQRGYVSTPNHLHRAHSARRLTLHACAHKQKNQQGSDASSQWQTGQLGEDQFGQNQMQMGSRADEQLKYGSERVRTFFSLRRLHCKFKSADTREYDGRTMRPTVKPTRTWALSNKSPEHARTDQREFFKKKKREFKPVHTPDGGAQATTALSSAYA